MCFVIQENDKNIKPVLELFARNGAMTSPLSYRSERPLWSEVDNAIEKAYEFGGSVRLDILSPEDSYIRTLNMMAIPGVFKLILLTRDEDVKKEILEWWEADESTRRGVIKFGDDVFDVRTSTSDVTVAKNIFSHLNETGELDKEIIAEFRSQWCPKK